LDVSASSSITPSGAQCHRGHSIESLSRMPRANIKVMAAMSKDCTGHKVLLRGARDVMQIAPRKTDGSRSYRKATTC